MSLREGRRDRGVPYSTTEQRGGDLNPEEKSRRPKDTPFRQQRVKSWLPILQPTLVVGIFLAIGAVFIPLGWWFNWESNEVIEITERYDLNNTDGTGCEISEAGQGLECTITIEIEEYVEPPTYVYYELEGYYQNHRRYVKSRSAHQLLGERIWPKDDFCDPMEEMPDGVLLNPCGLIANSMFNDTIKLAAPPASFQGSADKVFMSEEGISWESDRKKRFKQPPGFVFAEVGTKDCPLMNSTCSKCLTGEDSPYEGCGNYTDSRTGKSYKYWYRHDDKVQYLYEIYPSIVSPIEGVLNEHFIVWMRTAGLPRFRKVYGRIDEPLFPTDLLIFNITANFDVGDFHGKKSLIISNTSFMGAKNPYLGIAYVALGALSLVIGFTFAAKHYSDPRKLGDTKFLVWKDTTL